MLLGLSASFVFVHGRARVLVQWVVETIDCLVRIVQGIPSGYSLHSVWANSLGEGSYVKLQILWRLLVKPSVSADVMVFVLSERAPLVGRFASLLRQMVLEKGKGLVKLILLLLFGLVKTSSELTLLRAVIKHLWIAANRKWTPACKLRNRGQFLIL